MGERAFLSQDDPMVPTVSTYSSFYSVWTSIKCNGEDQVQRITKQGQWVYQVPKGSITGLIPYICDSLLCIKLSSLVIKAKESQWHGEKRLSSQGFCKPCLNSLCATWIERPRVTKGNMRKENSPLTCFQLGICLPAFGMRICGAVVLGNKQI